MDPFRTTDVNQGFVYDRQMKNPGKKIKLLETPKTYSTKQFLWENCGQDKDLGYSKNE